MPGSGRKASPDSKTGIREPGSGGGSLLPNTSSIVLHPASKIAAAANIPIRMPRQFITAPSLSQYRLLA
jgi:hypothetical protein